MNYLTGIRLNGFPEQSSYLANLPVVKYLQSLEELAFEKPVTFFVGENGTGKSTLLEAIAVALGFNPEGGSRDFSFSTKSSHSVLHQYLTTIKSGYPKDGFFLRAESFYNTATYLDEHSTLLRYGGVSFHAQSHGESFLSLVTALSPQRLMSLMIAIDELVEENSQFVIATHSPILMTYPKAEILEMTDTGIHKVKYSETEHYKITKQFLDDPERMLRYLFRD